MHPQEKTKNIFQQLAIYTIFIALFTSQVSAAEKKLDGFLGIPWGATPEQASKIMYSHKTINDIAPLRPTGITNETEIVCKGYYWGYGCLQMDLKFHNGKFTDAYVMRLGASWQELEDHLTKEYGPRDNYDNKSDMWEFGPEGNRESISITLFAAMDGDDEPYYCLGYSGK